MGRRTAEQRLVDRATSLEDEVVSAMGGEGISTLSFMRTEDTSLPVASTAPAKSSPSTLLRGRNRPSMSLPANQKGRRNTEARKRQSAVVTEVNGLGHAVLGVLRQRGLASNCGPVVLDGLDGVPAARVLAIELIE